MNITSTHNEKVKKWQKLKEKKYREEEHAFLIESEHLVNIAYELGLVKEIITTTNNRYNVPTYYTTDKVMKLLSDQKSSTNIVGICNFIEEKPIKGNILLLDNLQDPGNLGTIIRSAVAFNFDTIVLGPTCVDVYNSKVLRATEGMLFHMNIIKRDLKEFIKNLSDDYTLVTTDVKSGKNLKDIIYHKIALVIGNEGQGVSKEISNLCAERVNIKMNNKCESLNAGVCASILMYEVNNE